MNNNKLTFKEIITNSQYRAIFALMIYFVIFLILIISIRVSSSLSVNNTNKKVEQNVVTEGINSIKNKNYNFVYIDKKDNIERIYKGKQRDKKILFYLNDTEYYLNEDVLLKKENDKYVLETEKIYEIYNFFDIDDLLSKIEKGTEKDERIAIKYNDFFDPQEGSDDLNIYVNLKSQNGIVTSIEIDLIEYYKLYESSVESHLITMNFSDFGLIEDFNVE